MTVCVAAITREGYIVTASDTMLSGVAGSTDKATAKLELFHDDWTLMLSADDIGQCIPIIDEAREIFRGKPNTLREARIAVKTAYQRRLSEICADEVLGRFGMTMEEFRGGGSESFSEPEFNQMCQQMREVKVGCEFLAYGFDADRKPHIFTVAEPGVDSVHDKPGYAAIGSGAWAATGILLSLNLTRDMSLYETAFRVLASKFAAEKVPGVGKQTFFYVKEPGSTMLTVSSSFLPLVREKWESHGSPRVPDGVVDEMQRSGIRLNGNVRDESK